jgi:endonuclease/exonuclease/phosphatase family metal-dependent hydrolase
MISAVFSVATWNLKFNSTPDRTLSYLQHARWDIACLQEVSRSASALLGHRENWTVVDGLKLASQELSSWKRPHATAIVARNGWRLEDSGVVADTPTPGRGVRALVRRDDEFVSVISWHAPNAAGEGVETKMAGYRAVVTAIGATDGPLVVGLDSNHWSLRTDLDLVDHNADSPFAFENQFFSGDPQHRLRDALNVYLRENRDVYEELINRRPNGPLEVTYKRGGTLDRFDYIMVSDHFHVDEISHDFEGAREAGSDHGLVSAVLSRHASR